MTGKCQLREPGAKAEGLTKREGIFWDALLGGKGLADAGREAGYGEECLGPARWQTLQGVKATMPEILWRHGLTAETFAMKLRELVDAKKKRVFAYKGRIFATRVMKDYRTQIRAVQIWARILGLFDHPKTVESGPCAIRIVYERPLGPVGSPALLADGGEVTRGVVSQPRNLLTEGSE
jgi:hypothetical protein